MLTNGGPRDLTHVFATYAFQVGILSGNIPRGAAVRLFMFPILAICAFFVLRGVTRRNKEADVMSATAAQPATCRASTARPAACAPSGAGRCWTAYISLVIAAIIFLAPPFYMLITSLKTSGGDRRPAGQPLDGARPDAGELLRR